MSRVGGRNLSVSRRRQLMHLYSFRNIPPFTCIFVRAGFSWLGICLQDFLKRSQGNYIGLNDGLMICPPSIQTAFRTSVFLPKYFDKVVNWVCGTIALHGRKRVSMLSVPVNFFSPRGHLKLGKRSNFTDQRPLFIGEPGCF